MALSSAEKRAKQTEVRTQRNRSVKTRVKTAIRRFEQCLEEKDIEKARQALKAAQSTIDRAVSKGVYHKNTAGRKKSRLWNEFNEFVGKWSK